MPAESELYNVTFEAPYHAANALRRLSIPGPYLVTSYGDEHRRFWTFAGALECIVAMARNRFAWELHNLDRCDGGGGDDGQGFHDGVTDEEREQLDEAIAKVRGG